MSGHFLILERLQQTYQGVERPEPLYHGPLENPEANALFDWFFLTDIDRDHGSVDSEEKAQQVLEIYREVYREQLATSGKAYEIIEVTSFKDKPTKYTRFLGYDVAALHRWSLIQGLFPHNQPGEGELLMEKLNTVRYDFSYLYLLLAGYFSPFLNEYGLFSAYANAYFYYKCFHACYASLDTTGAFEPPETYEVVGVWRAV